MVELLLYVLLASGITAALSQVLIAVIRSDRNIDLQQRAIDLWSRIAFLIESDVAEGNQIFYNVDLPPACGTGKALFSVRVPVPAEGVVPGEGRTLWIHYFASSGNLMRCGPPFHQDGQLDVSPAADAGDTLLALVGRRVQVLIQPNEDQARSVHYHLNILTPDGAELFHPSRSSIARTRVGEVPIPP
jgi:hypothetical protein